MTMHINLLSTTVIHSSLVNGNACHFTSSTDFDIESVFKEKIGLVHFLHRFSVTPGAQNDIDMLAVDSDKTPHDQSFPV